MNGKGPQLRAFYFGVGQPQSMLLIASHRGRTDGTRGNAG